MVLGVGMGFFPGAVWIWADGQLFLFVAFDFGLGSVVMEALFFHPHSLLFIFLHWEGDSY